MIFRRYLIEISDSYSNGTSGARSLDKLDPRIQAPQVPSLGPPQAFIELDLESGTLNADGEPEGSDSVPESVRCRRKPRWDIPLLTASGANTLLAELAPGTAHPRRRNHRTEPPRQRDAQDAEEYITRTIDAIEREEYGHVEASSAAEFLTDLTAKDLDVTADTTDDELIAKEAEIQNDVEPGTPGGYVVI
jgi:hypothetical protein